MTLRVETLAVHAGQDAASDENGPVLAPIVMSTSFERSVEGSFKHGLIYTRAQNPNRNALEKALAALEGGVAAAAFASGSAATLAVLQALAPGDHVIATGGFYGTVKLIDEIMRPWGLEATLLDTRDTDAVRAAVRPRTRLLWIETPSNPMLSVSDVAACADIAHRAGARLVCDNTVGTPLGQRCFDLGADLVMHSTTKYLGGHSDVLGGAIVAPRDDELFARVRTLQAAGGAVPSPFDCWLLARGLRTLPLRVRAQAQGAQRVAEALTGLPGVERVLYPGLSDHPGHALAARQMRGFGGLLSFIVAGRREAALAFAGRLRLIRRATSLGAVESNIDHRESVEPAGFGAPAGLLRLSVGIEHPDDLIDDLAQAARSR